MKNKWFVVGIGFLILLGGVYFFTHVYVREPKFSVTFLNIGQGDAALIQFGNGQKMLVDCGLNKIVLSRLGEVLPFYDRTIDYVLATHPDLDHYGGCVDVLKNYQVKEIITNGHGKPDDPYWQEWDRARHAEGAVLKVVNGYEELQIGSSTLQFFSPDDALDLHAAAEDSNDYSIVFKLTHAGESFLFTGDMEVLLEHALMQKYCPAFSNSPLGRGRGGLADSSTSTMQSCPMLQSDILKVGHHGSNSSSGEDFLALVKPKQAIISVGKNTYGHPSLRVIKHLERAGAQIFRTDQLGNITRE